MSDTVQPISIQQVLVGQTVIKQCIQYVHTKMFSEKMFMTLDLGDEKTPGLKGKIDDL